MKLATALAALMIVGGTAACSRDRDPGSGLPRVESRGIPDAKNTGVNVPESASADHEHAGMPEPRTSEPRTAGSRPDIVLNPDMIARAGIKTVAAVKGTSSTRLHLPGVVQPNAYKNIDVTSLVSGRVTQVRAELGQRVMLNEVLATVYSPELADAQTTFIAARAEHLAHDQAQARTQRLYAIGAASRQELERLEAEKSEMDAKVETARARLVLLGIPEEKTQRLASPADVVTTFDVKSPIAGIVTKRSANPGLNIDLATALFTRRQSRLDHDAGLSGHRSTRARGLHRPAGAAGDANGQAPRRGAQQRQPTPVRDVRRRQHRRAVASSGRDGAEGGRADRGRPVGGVCLDRARPFRAARRDDW